MPLDHYVSQVHLKKFYSPTLNGRMYAIRKSDLVCFSPRSQDVCRLEDNSSNAYLKEDRAIEEFLKTVEPRYNVSLAKLRENKIDQECVHCIAGFVAYATTCSPAGMRIHSRPLKSEVESASMLLDRKGIFKKAPASLGGKSLTVLLQDGTVKVTIDPKYPQALGIDSIMKFVSVFGNSFWEILYNDEQDCPFFTSDYPVAIEVTDPRIPINRIAPLAPDLAIRILPDVRLSRSNPDFSFAKFRAVERPLKRVEILNINRLIVRCAEDLIFYRDGRDWIEPFVRKNRHYRIEPISYQILQGKGFLNVSTLRIVAREPDAR